MDWYKLYFGEDTPLWFVLLMLREMVEILFQIFAAFNYNGLNLLNKTQLVLAYNENSVKLFAILLSTNSIICGIFWTFYVFGNHLCRGIFFKQMLFVVDTIFDSLYALYPIIVIYNEPGPFRLSMAVAVLQTTNLAGFGSTLMPISYLLIKCLLLFQKTRYQLKKNAYLQINPQNTNIEDSTENKIELTAVRSISNNTPTTPTQQIGRQKPKLKQKQQQQLLKAKNKVGYLCSRGIVLFLSVVYICLGIVFIVGVFEHFAKANQLCSTPNKNTLRKNPELFLWDQCTFQTVPFKSANMFTFEMSCNCRRAQIDVSSFPNGQIYLSQIDDNYNFTKSDTNTDNVNVAQMIESLFKNWDMLQLLYVNDKSDRFQIDLNDSLQYNAKYLKILHLNNVKLTTVTNDIGNWRELEYLYVTHAHWEGGWPPNFEMLNKISYLYLWDTFSIDSLPSNLCQMSNLRAINIFQSPASGKKIEIIPHCIIDLSKLQSIIIYFATLNQIPFELFSMKSMNEIGLMFAPNLTIESFRNENGSIMSQDEWNTFSWKQESNATYYLTESRLCYHKYLSDSTLDIPNRLYQFLSETQACKIVCDGQSLFNLVCLPFDWRNGVCNEQCNVEECLWDGGDCNIMCVTRYSDSCNMFNMFNNHVCDIGCNQTECNFDNGECLDDDTGFNISIFGNNATYCDKETKLCPIEWINDGWCDDNCRLNEECFYDYNDCICDADKHCYPIYKLVMPFMDTTFINNETNRVEQAASYDHACTLWDNFRVLVNTGADLEEPKFVIEWAQQNQTCDFVFDRLDLNNNSFIQFHELLLYGRDYYGYSEAKAQQINCTSCMA